MTDKITVNGHRIELSEGRKVWAGNHDDSWYIRFDDGAGNERKFRISQEAADALLKLLTVPQTVMRFKLMVDGKAMQWEAFEPALIAAINAESLP